MPLPTVGGTEQVLGKIERADDGWLLHPSWPIQHLRDASGVRSAIAVRTRRLAGPVRLRTVYQLISERSAKNAEFRPLNETEHAEVLLTGHFKDESRVLRPADWRDTVTIAHAWGWHGPAGWNVARPVKWSAEQTAAAILEQATSDAGMPRGGEYDRRHEHETGGWNDQGTATAFHERLTDQHESASRGPAARPIDYSATLAEFSSEAGCPRRRVREVGQLAPVASDGVAGATPEHTADSQNRRIVCMTNTNGRGCEQLRGALKTGVTALCVIAIADSASFGCGSNSGPRPRCVITSNLVQSCQVFD